MYRKIDITPAEMLIMREDGMSNRDIANVLDISVATVRKYIGNQGGRMDSFEAFKEKRREVEEHTSLKVEVPKYSPKPIEETYAIGSLAVTLNNDEKQMILQTSEGGMVRIPYDLTPELTQFVVWAMRERMEAAADGQTEQV